MLIEEFSWGPFNFWLRVYVPVPGDMYYHAEGTQRYVASLHIKSPQLPLPTVKPTRDSVSYSEPFSPDGMFCGNFCSSSVEDYPSIQAYIEAVRQANYKHLEEVFVSRPNPDGRGTPLILKKWLSRNYALL